MNCKNCGKQLPANFRCQSSGFCGDACLLEYENKNLHQQLNKVRQERDHFKECMMHEYRCAEASKSAELQAQDIILDIISLALDKALVPMPNEREVSGSRIDRLIWRLKKYASLNK